MSTENIVKNKYYRILKDKTNAIWDRISFWTHADDVELSSGATLSSDLTSKQTKIDATMSDLGQVETSPSTHAYTKGQLLVYNNQLYRVISAIAVGNTLSVGSNIQSVTVSTLSSMLTATNGNQFYFDYYNSKPGFYPTASKTSSSFVPFGGTMTETNLWTNPNPSSAISSAMNITLSQSVENFKYIGFEYKGYMGSTITIKMLIPLEDYRKSTNTNGNALISFGARSSNALPCRTFYYNTDTTATINTVGNNNNYGIPIRIFGCK